MTRKLAALFAPLLLAMSLIAHTAEPAEGAERGAETCATAHEYALVKPHMLQPDAEAILDGPGFIDPDGVHVYRLCGHGWRYGQLWMEYSDTRRATTIWWVIAAGGQLAYPLGLFQHRPA